MAGTGRGTNYTIVHCCILGDISHDKIPLSFIVQFVNFANCVQQLTRRSSISSIFKRTLVHSVNLSRFSRSLARDKFRDGEREKERKRGGSVIVVVNDPEGYFQFSPSVILTHQAQNSVLSHSLCFTKQIAF